MTDRAGFETMEEGFDLQRAFAEASRCLLCHDAPCSKACPGGTDPGSFIRKLRLQNVKGAIRTIKENNVLGGTCGVLCPAASLCEKECAAAGLDRPIRIGKIQRALVEHSWQLGFEPLAPADNRRAEKVAVVGSGPAGLACAAELARNGFPVTVFEAKERAGGVLAHGVPAYRLSSEFLEKELDDVRRLGVELRLSSPVQGPGAAEALLKQGFAAVFLAPGCWEPLRLDPDPREPAPRGLLSSTDFLGSLREGSGEDTASLVENSVVAVLGGGSVAMDCVGSALRLGARDVYLIYRRSYAQMPAEEDEKREMLEAGAHFLLLQQPVSYVSAKAGAGSRLTGVSLARTRLGDEDHSGRRRPLEVPGSEWILPVDVVVEALGARPQAGLRELYPSVEMARGERVVADPETCRTSVPGIYAGGDIVRGPALVILAVQDGKRAARAIIEDLAAKEEPARREAAPKNTRGVERRIEGGAR